MTIVLAMIGLLSGALTGEWLSRRESVHQLAGRIFGRGELVALVGRRGVFDQRLIADEVLRVSAAHTPMKKGEIEHALIALRGQFGDEGSFAAALHANGIWRWQWPRMVAEALRGARWLDEKIARESTVSFDESRYYFDEHQADFVQPLRLRPRHIFLAAPQGSENMEEKRAAMQEIMGRLANGEDFAALAAELSEDEASKSRGGDLGFLASNRVPLEFWNAIEGLPVNGPAAFVQSHLGFHAVQILDVRLPRSMSFEEARPEIEQLMAAQKRRLAAQNMRQQLARQAILVSR